MMWLFKMSLKSIRKKTWFSILTLIVCVIAMQTVCSAITNAGGVAYQKAMFKDNFALDMNSVLHLSFKDTSEDPEFAKTLRDYLSFIETLEGVKSVGQFDSTGVYFKELKENEQYIAVNQEIRNSRKYNKFPSNSQIIYADEAVLSMIQGGVSQYAKVRGNALPIYVSEEYGSIIAIGDRLTEEYTDTAYEVAGYIPNNSFWPEENDIIRFPMIKLDCFFVAPFSEAGKGDVMEQLSSLHNTYVVVSDDADINAIKNQIAAYPEQQGFKATAQTINEEFEGYENEMKTVSTGQLVLAVFICVMALSSVVSIFTTNALLKKKYYGVLVANGYTLFDVIKSMTLEIFVIMLFSSVGAWLLKLREFAAGKDLFRAVFLTAHIQFSLPLCLALVVILTALSAVLPAYIIKKYQPCELLGDSE